MKKTLFLVSMLIALFLLVNGCSKDDSPSTPTPTIKSFVPPSGPVGTEVKVNGSNFSTKSSENTVKIGNATATVKQATASQLTVTVPQGATTGKVSVTVDGKTGTSSSNFTVTEEENPISVVLNSTALTLYPFPQYTGSLEVTSDVQGNTVVWSSSNESVATVGQNGLVTPVALGTATITATVGTIAANATVTVADGPVTKLEIDNSELELFVDDTASLSIATLESDADVDLAGAPVWVSNKPAVASVDVNTGEVTAINQGTATITVTVDNASVTCEVTVNPDVYVLGKHFEGAVVWKNGLEQTLLPDVVNPSSLFVADNGFIYVLDEEEGGNVPEVWQIDLDGQVTQSTALQNPMQDSYTNGRLFVHNGSVYVAAASFGINDNAPIIWVDGFLSVPFEGLDVSMLDFFLRDGTAYMVIRDLGSGFYGLLVGEQTSQINAFGQAALDVSSLYVDENEDVYITVKGGGGLNGLYVNEIQNLSIQGTDPLLEDVFVEQGIVYLAGDDVGSSTVWTNGIPTTLDLVDSSSTNIFVSNGQTHVIGHYIPQISNAFLPAYWKNNILVENYFNIDNLDDSDDILTIDIFVK